MIIFIASHPHIYIFISMGLKYRVEATSAYGRHRAEATSAYGRHHVKATSGYGRHRVEA